MTQQHDLFPWVALSSSDRQAWAEMRAANETLRSPYFDPGYCQALASAGCAPHVLKVHRAGAPQGFLPLHISRWGFAHPPSGPLSDWHGFIAAPGVVIDAEAALKAVGLVGYRFQNAPKGDQALVRHASVETYSQLIDLSVGPDAWWAARKRALRGLSRHEKKVADEGLSTTLILDDRRPEVLSTLLAWKSEQLRATRQPDIFRRPWVPSLLRHLHSERDSDLRGVLSSLEVDGRLAAVQFSLAGGHVLHHWFPAYNKAFGRYGVGALLLKQVAMGSAALGISEIDLGKGDYRYKREFANGRADLIEGVVAPGLAGVPYKAALTTSRSAAELSSNAVARLPLRALRRLEFNASLGSVSNPGRRRAGRSYTEA